jgi:pilus assembly protein Flp/PilA
MLFNLILVWMRSVYSRYRVEGHKLMAGQGLVEYALILILISVTVIVLLTVLGPAITNIYTNIIESVGEAGTK